MKNFIETNFVAYSAIKTGEVVAVDVAHSSATIRAVVPATKTSTTIIGVAGQGGAAGQAINVIPMQLGVVMNVYATEAITAGHALALDASGVVDDNSSVSGELPLHMVALEAASAAGDLIAAVCVLNTVANS